MKLFSTLATFKLLCLSGLLLVSCNRVETLFEIPARVDMIIPAGSNTFEILGLTTEVLFPYEISLASRGIADASVDRVVAQRAVFRPVFAAIDLNFINVIEINVVDPDDPTITREVFFIDPIPLGPKNEIDLFASLPDIKDFISDGNMLLFEVELTFRSVPTTNIDIRIDMEFGAVADE